MMKLILGKKIEMSQKFKDDEVIPVTIIRAGPCYVTQIKRKEKDGYEAIQIGFEKKKTKKVKKTEKGKEFRYLREFKDDISKYKVGDEIKVEIFKPGEKVNISGISKGKGFAGVIKRWGFKGMPASHGTKHDARHSGSIGATAPQRVLKGKKMAGRMGGKRVTVKNLTVVEVDPEKNLLVVKGAIPGARGSLVEIKGE
ncbi:MAG: 50S ribosomal protein L3 [Patescibacteria group bacterium]